MASLMLQGAAGRRYRKDAADARFSTEKRPFSSTCRVLAPSPALPCHIHRVSPLQESDTTTNLCPADAIMKTSLSLLTAAVMICSVSASRADSDELFSDVNSGSVFAPAAGSTATGGQRMQTGEDLRELLKAAGFDAKVTGSRTATSEKKLDPWTFPLLLELSEDESTVTVVLGLATIKQASTELPAAKLLEMMSISRRHAPAVILYNADRERTEIARSLDNRQLSGDQLRRVINRMAILARDNATVWANAEQTQALQPATTPDPSTPPTAQAPSTPSVPTTPAPAAPAPTAPAVSNSTLAGKWAASRSATEAFGIEFKADGTFNLVYVNNGQQSKSAGRFTVTTNSLQLNGNDGLKLGGNLTLTSTTEFRFEPAGSAAMIFRKAR